MTGALTPGDPLAAAVDSAQPPAGSPPSDQAQPPAAAATPAAPEAIPEDVRLLRQSYTQATQLNSAIRKELGLSREATAQDFIDAIAARSRPANDDGDDGVDPTVRARLEQLDDRGWELERKIYGGAADKARAFAEAARTTSDPAELMAIFYSAMTELANEAEQQPTNGAAPAGASAQPVSAAQPPAVPPLGGEAPLQQPTNQQPPAAGDRRATGDMLGFVRQFGFGRGGNNQQGG